MGNYKRAIVTGGAGFIGSHLADALLARGVQVLIVDDLSSGFRKHLPKAAKFLKKSILHPAFLKAAVAFKPDVVFHLAAAASVPESVARPAETTSVNLVGTICAAEAALLGGARSFVFSSTGGALYSEGDIPFGEHVPAMPKSPYGIAKKAAEDMLGFFTRERGLPCAILRYANVYGPRQISGGEGAVVPSFADALLAGRPVVIHGTGDQTRDFTYVDDIVAANLLAADAGVTGTYNIGTGCEVSVNALLHTMEEIFGAKADVHHGPARTGDLVRSCLSASRAKKDFGWEPKITMEEGLDLVAEWYGIKD